MSECTPLDALANRISGRLKSKKFCVTFENELEHIWPRDNVPREKRREFIFAFAEANGWDALILDPGIHVTFREKRKAGSA